MRRTDQTIHGATRAQQRALPPLVIDWLQAYGREHHDHRGMLIYYFDRRARRRLERAVGAAPLRLMDRWLRAYAVFASNGQLVTAGYRYRRIRHPSRTSAIDEANGHHC
jgi:hypothetical protein